jgi:hypothetical protein
MGALLPRLLAGARVDPEMGGERRSIQWRAIAVRHAGLNEKDEDADSPRAQRLDTLGRRGAGGRGGCSRLIVGVGVAGRLERAFACAPIVYCGAGLERLCIGKLRPSSRGLIEDQECEREARGRREGSDFEHSARPHTGLDVPHLIYCDINLPQLGAHGLSPKAFAGPRR